MFICPCCGSSESRPACTVVDRLYRTTDRKFELRECQACGAVFLWPIPNEAELAGFYPPGYWWQTDSASEPSGAWSGLLQTYRQLMVASHVRRIKRLTESSAATCNRLLDVGCGDGLFLASCQPLRLAAIGLDRSFDALRAARRRSGLGLIQGRVDTLPFADESFRLITLFHVLEHLPAPNLFLQEARRLLVPGGWLVVQVPNAASLQRRLLGRYWEGFEAPRHLVNYSERSLGLLLGGQGFRVAHVDHFSIRDNPALLARSFLPHLYPLARRVGARRGKAESWTNSLLDVAYLLLVVLAIPWASFESLLGHGATIVVQARKA